MKFTELNPEFVAQREGRTGTHIRFNCPCGQLDSLGDRDVLFIPLESPLDGGVAYRPGWKVKDPNFETFTLEPSVKRLNLCFFHFNVTNGTIVIHADSGKKTE